MQLAGTDRVFAMFGWTGLIYNPITVRVPETDSHFLINPFGLHDTEVTAPYPVKIDIESIAIRADEGPRLIANLGDRRPLIVRNHALLAIGETIAHPKHGAGEGVLRALLHEADAIDGSYRDL